ncbi:MAG: SCP2 sterol-binding domain-containing protein [Deltaproteobacteria bacterium]|nr:SCP2 sterol-binding domain-containing protein [Deltaproteobacteria bacterium]
MNGQDGGVWTVNMKDAPGVTEGDQGNAECTIELSTDDWKAMTEKPATAMQFFMHGKIERWPSSKNTFSHCYRTRGSRS